MRFVAASRYIVFMLAALLALPAAAEVRVLGAGPDLEVLAVEAGYRTPTVVVANLGDDPASGMLAVVHERRGRAVHSLVFVSLAPGEVVSLPTSSLVVAGVIDDMNPYGAGNVQRAVIDDMNPYGSKKPTTTARTKTSDGESSIAVIDDMNPY
jgi:hypothetical protein